MASAERELGQAIEFVQNKNYEAGARMLNAVLKRPDLSNAHRAVGYIWLAETQSDINFKIQCLSQAQEFDPRNETIKQRLNYWLARQPRQTPYPTQRPTPQPPGQQQQQGNTNANPLFPDSMLINLPPAEMSDSQELRALGNPPEDERRTTGSARVQDDEQRSRIFDRISPPQRTGDTGPTPRISDFDQYPAGTAPNVTPPQGQPPYNPQNPQQGGQGYNPQQGGQPQPPYNPQNPQQGGQGYNPQQGGQPQPPYNQPNPNLSDSKPINPFNQPPNQPMQQSSSPHKLTEMSRVVGIKHGPNGEGSGVFVTLDGVIATTRNVVGGAHQVMVEIDTNYETTGQVIRSYPLLDLALVHVNVELERVWPRTPMPMVMDGDAFVSISAGQNVIRGNHRQSAGQVKQHWITTTVRLDQIKGAGGDALYDANNYLLGILTKNASRETGYVYGIHILAIYEKVNEYIRERQQMPQAGYCHHCGNITRAQLYGGYYCETCGALRPGMDKVDRENRSSPQLLQIYNENLSKTCPRCRARVGYHNSKCLRCSYDLEGRK